MFLQRAQLLADQQTALARADADQAYAPVGEIQHLQRARIPDEPRDVFGDQLLGADPHVHRQRLVGKQLRMTRVFGRTDAGDLGARAVQRVGDFARHHVDLVARGQRDDDVGRSAARGFEYRWIGGIAGDGANVEAVLQVAQDFFIGVDDRDFVRFFARQVVCRRAPNLSGAKYHDLHGGGIVRKRGQVYLRGWTELRPTLPP